jgi:hypothetical protein
MKYQLCRGGVLRKNDFAWIPADENNTDYQLFLQWVAMGNTPEPEPEK